MRLTFTACALAVLAAAGAQAQQPGVRPALSETAKRISDALSDKQDAQNASPGLNAAREVLSTLADKAVTELSQADAAKTADRKRITATLEEMTPEARALFAQASTAAPALGEGPRAKPLVPEPLTEPTAGPPPQKTIITSDDLFFDSAKSIAVFKDNVVVDSPSFHITADFFEVHMRKQEKDPAAKPGAPAPAGTKPGTAAAPAKPAPPKPDLISLAVTAPAVEPGKGGLKPTVPYHDDTIEAAIAKGRKVVIIKHNPDGKVQIGQSRYAYYDGDSGDITLKDNPQVQDGDNLHTAAEPSCVMVMTQAGALHTTGRSTTNLIKAAAPGTTPATPAAPGTAPASGTVPASNGAVKTQKGFSIPVPGPGQ